MNPPDRDRARALPRIELLNASEQGIPRSEDDLHICRRCRSRLVQPVEWAPVDMRRWRVELRCPECEWESAGVYPQHVLDRFDAILDQGAASLVDDLTRLQRANMEAEISRFVGAVERGGILPEDF